MYTAPVTCEYHTMSSEQSGIPKVSLLIDCQNFLGKIEDVFKSNGQPKPNLTTYNFKQLVHTALNGMQVSEQIIYAARINEHPDTLQKSQHLILERRRLKRHLENQGFTYVHAGNIRGHYHIVPYSPKPVLVFKEKGVDVRIGVDMVYKALTRQADTIILCSSDSDLQPAVRLTREAGVEVIYLGFETIPNKGLVATTNKTILFRNTEVLRCAV